MIAQILVFAPSRFSESLILDYAIPADLVQAVQLRMLVAVPVQSRLLPGIVMGITATSAVPDAQLKQIHSLLGATPPLTERLVELAHWMARETLSPLHRCIQAMLPPGMRPRTIVQFHPLVNAAPAELAPTASALLTLLRQGPLTQPQVAKAFKGQDWRSALRELRSRECLRVERLLDMPQLQPKTVRLVQLKAPQAEWASRLEGVRLQALYTDILAFLEEERQPVAMDVVAAETGAKDTHFAMLKRRELIAFSTSEIMRDPLQEMIFTPDAPLRLLPEQNAAWEEIARLLAQTGAKPPVLLLGVTGSGKTELYLRATEAVLAKKRQALILVPEISLTPQTVRRFVVRFPGQVALWHSGMSDGERYDTWRRVRDGEVGIVVGARSALFAPFPNLGLIVMDEEEDSSYKQSSSPLYHAREVAEQLARSTHALLLMGSATPSLESYVRAQEGRYRLLEMPQRVLGHRRRIGDWQKLLHLSGNRYHGVDDSSDAITIDMPAVQIIDMRAELRAGNRTVFSTALEEAVDTALSKKEQVILFLNRRGGATHVFCRDCGWTATCPRCSIPLTYHTHADKLICHHCAYQRAMVSRCPKCSSQRVRAFGLGTEGLEAKVAERWPSAEILRWDRDIAHSHAAHSRIMGRFSRGEADILLGTQMVARGLDIPKVTVVGVISADTTLNLPDFRAAERAFQLLAQVAGRSGRGLLGGRVVFQTYHPEHYAVQYAAAHDYVGFARRELAFRRRAGYPPAVRLARLLYTDRDAKAAEAGARKLATRLLAQLAAAGRPASDIIGPAPAFFARVRGRYRWQILLRHVAPADFLRSIELPAGWIVDIDPVDVL